ncbi:hypothetical protein BJX68DRAFT_267341 [Aspergillus pseudodeflectus]|uniref:Myb-like domain-containing protein n=1 Tax=Aspergillus pseudodeflectus TaxID=176178 RepID=A0ABR4KCI0_9EURO
MVNLDLQMFWEPKAGDRTQSGRNARATSTLIPPEVHPAAAASRGKTPPAQTSIEMLESRDLGEFVLLDKVTQATSPSMLPPAALSDVANFPEYPQEVALYASPQTDGSPSVTGLDGPGSSRVFDVFADDDDEGKSSRTSDSDTGRVLRPRKRRLDRPAVNSASKRISTRRPALAESSKQATQSGDSHCLSSAELPNVSADPPADSLCVLQAAVGCLQTLSTMIEERGHSDNLDARSGIVQHDLSVLQEARSKLQHAYGVVATRMVTARTTARFPRAAARTQPADGTAYNRRVPWNHEDDSKLINLKEVRQLSWHNIFQEFPTRTPGAIRTRHNTLLKASQQGRDFKAKSCRPTPITALSTELMRHIADYLSERDRAMLARTARQMHGGVNHFLYFYNAKQHDLTALRWDARKGY